MIEMKPIPDLVELDFASRAEVLALRTGNRFTESDKGKC